MEQASNRAELRRALKLARKLEKRLDDNVLDRMGWNKKQWHFATTHTDQAYLSGPNQAGGKSTILNAMCRWHASGDYPEEWNGPRFDRPVEIILLNVTNAKVQEINTDRLFGPYADRGAGLFPKSSFNPDRDLVPLPGGARGQIKEAFIRHRNIDGEYDGVSRVIIASYAHGWQALMGSTPDLILCDEEPFPFMVYDELSARLNFSRGMLRIAATPLHGNTRVRQLFKDRKNRKLEYIGYRIEDCTHLDQEHRQSIIDKYRDHPLESARVYGEAAEGEGRIYPDPILCEPFAVQRHHQALIGVDFPHSPTGWFAAVKAIYDPLHDRVNVVEARKSTGRTTAEYAEILRVMGGRDIPICWPHDGGVKGEDGRATYRRYRDDYGLNFLSEAAGRVNEFGKKSIAVMPIVEELFDRWKTGRIHFVRGQETERIRDEVLEYISVDGKIKKNQDDHCIDALHKIIMCLQDAQPVSESRVLLPFNRHRAREFQRAQRNFYGG